MQRLNLEYLHKFEWDKKYQILKIDTFHYDKYFLFNYRQVGHGGFTLLDLHYQLATDLYTTTSDIFNLNFRTRSSNNVAKLSQNYRGMPNKK